MPLTFIASLASLSMQCAEELRLLLAVWTTPPVKFPARRERIGKARLIPPEVKTAAERLPDVSNPKRAEIAASGLAKERLATSISYTFLSSSASFGTGEE